MILVWKEGKQWRFEVGITERSRDSKTAGYSLDTTANTGRNCSRGVVAPT
jgi:hypothetical protein